MISAEFESSCPGCGSRITKGTEIRLSAKDEPYGWLHQDCPDVPRASNTTTVCGGCSMQVRLTETGFCRDCMEDVA